MHSVRIKCTQQNTFSFTTISERFPLRFCIIIVRGRARLMLAMRSVNRPWSSERHTLQSRTLRNSTNCANQHKISLAQPGAEREATNRKSGLRRDPRRKDDLRRGDAKLLNSVGEEVNKHFLSQADAHRQIADVQAPRHASQTRLLGSNHCRRTVAKRAAGPKDGLIVVARNGSHGRRQAAAVEREQSSQLRRHRGGSSSRGGRRSNGRHDSAEHSIPVELRLSTAAARPARSALPRAAARTRAPAVTVRAAAGMRSAPATVPVPGARSRSRAPALLVARLVPGALLAGLARLRPRPITRFVFLLLLLAVLRTLTITRAAALPVLFRVLFLVLVAAPRTAAAAAAIYKTAQAE